MIQYDLEVESFSIMGNDHDPVVLGPGFKRVCNEIADGICPETVLSLTALQEIHNHVGVVLEHGAKLLDSRQIRHMVERRVCASCVLRGFEIIRDK